MAYFSHFKLFDQKLRGLCGDNMWKILTKHLFFDRFFLSWFGQGNERFT